MEVFPMTRYRRWLARRRNAHARHERRSQDGFTLVEILVVITILGILVAVVAPQVTGRIDQAKVTKAKLEIKAFSDALERYAIDTGDYPSTEEGLQALFTEPTSVTGWQGPYLQGTLKPDPWNNDYVYVYPGNHQDLGYPFDIISYGKDGKEGGEKTNADISNFGEALSAGM